MESSFYDIIIGSKGKSILFSMVHDMLLPMLSRSGASEVSHLQTAYHVRPFDPFDHPLLTCPPFCPSFRSSAHSLPHNMQNMKLNFDSGNDVKTRVLEFKGQSGRKGPRLH